MDAIDLANDGPFMYDLICSGSYTHAKVLDCVRRSFPTKVCSNVPHEGGATKSNRKCQYYSLAVATLLFYDYLLTLQDEASEPQ